MCSRKRFSSDSRPEQSPMRSEKISKSLVICAVVFGNWLFGVNSNEQMRVCLLFYLEQGYQFRGGKLASAYWLKNN